MKEAQDCLCLFNERLQYTNNALLTISKSNTPSHSLVFIAYFLGFQSIRFIHLYILSMLSRENFHVGLYFITFP